MKKKTLQFLIGAAAAAMVACAPAAAEEIGAAAAEVGEAVAEGIAEAVAEGVAEAAEEAAAPEEEDGQQADPLAGLEEIVADQEAVPVAPEETAPALPQEEQAQAQAPAQEAEAIVAGTDEEAEAVEEETEEADDFVEGSALLSELGYEAGEIGDDGWKSEWLGMAYVPAKGVKISAEDVAKMKEYYGRHGEDKMVANNEFVAKLGSDAVMQLMVEVNPNGESAKDVLANFVEIEELELVSKTRETEIGGKKFVSCTGVREKEKYMVGVCDEVDGAILAVKVKYKDTASRKTMVGGFEKLADEEGQEAATEAAEAATEAAEAAEATEKPAEAAAAGAGALALGIPEEFEDALLIEEGSTESAPEH